MSDSLVKLQKQAIAYTSEGKALEAIATYEQIVKLEPNLAEAHGELGKLLDAQGWQELAIPHYAKALSLAPGGYSPESHFNLGNLLQSRGDREGAIASYKRAIELNPTYISAYKAWVETLIQGQRFDEAIDVYVRAEYYVDDSIGAKEYNDLGIACIDRGKLELAIACFQKAIYIQPTSASAHCNLGNTLLQQQNFKEAIISFQEALSIDPSFVEVYYNLGLALTKVNKLDEAIACFEAAIALQPEFMEAKYYLEKALNLKI